MELIHLFSYEEYSDPVIETYDNVVSNTLSLLRGWTMDERARLVRSVFKEKDVSLRKKWGVYLSYNFELFMLFFVIEGFVKRRQPPMLNKFFPRDRSFLNQLSLFNVIFMMLKRSCLKDSRV